MARRHTQPMKYLTLLLLSVVSAWSQPTLRHINYTDTTRTTIDKINSNTLAVTHLAMATNWGTTNRVYGTSYVASILLPGTTNGARLVTLDDFLTSLTNLTGWIPGGGSGSITNLPSYALTNNQTSAINFAGSARFGAAVTNAGDTYMPGVGAVSGIMQLNAGGKVVLNADISIAELNALDGIDIATSIQGQFSTTSNGVMSSIMTASNNLYVTETTRNAAVSNSVVGEIMTASNNVYTTETTRNAAVSNALQSAVMTASNNVYSAAAIAGSTFGTDNRAIISDGTGRGVAVSLLAITDSGGVMPAANNSQDIGAPGLIWNDGLFNAISAAQLLSSDDELIVAGAAKINSLRVTNGVTHSGIVVSSGTNIISGSLRLPAIATNTLTFIGGESNVVGLTLGGGLSISAGALVSTGVLPDGDKGDVVVSASGAIWTVDTAAISYSKLQDVTATQRVLGRNTSGSGDVEEVTGSQLLDWIGSTQGDILYRGASGWSVLPAGTSGHLLHTLGAGANPTWAQVLSLTDGDKGDITVASSGASFTIDPGAVTSSKFAAGNSVTNVTAYGFTAPLVTAGQVDVRTNLNFATATGTNSLTAPLLTAGQIDIRTNAYSSALMVTNAADLGTLTNRGAAGFAGAVTHTGTMRGHGAYTNLAGISVVGAGFASYDGADYVTMTAASGGLDTSLDAFSISPHASTPGTIVLQGITANRPAFINPQGAITNASGTPDGTKFMRDDGVLAVPTTGGSTNVTTLAVGSVTVSNALIVPWVAKTNAAFVNSGSGLNQYADLVVNTNLQFVPLSGIHASNNIPIKVAFTQDTTGTRTLTFNGIALGVDTNSLAVTECLFWVQNGITNATVSFPYFPSVTTPGQLLIHNGLYWTNDNRVPVVNAGTVNATTNLNGLSATVTNTLTASNVVAIAGGTNTLGPTDITNRLNLVVGNTTTNATVGGTIYKKTTLTAFTNLNTTIATFTNGSQFIIPAHTLTNDGDSVICTFGGNLLAGTNSFKFWYGYDVVLSTGSFTNAATPWEASMEITRTAGVGALARARFNFGQIGPVALAATSISGMSTNWVISCTNGTAITNVVQMASNRAGAVSNNFHRVVFEPASR
jgi:hypothetical protein